MENLWSAVDNYFGEALLAESPLMRQVLAANAAAGLPAYDVSPNQGKLLQLFCQLTQAKRVLEVGTLGAYSTIWMARALPPEGRLITIEVEPLHAWVAQDNIERAGLGDRIEVRVGVAHEILAALNDEGAKFDLVFIDADKKRNAEYFRWALAMSHPGTLIIVDNVVRHGKVIKENSDDPSVIGVHRLIDLIRQTPSVSATVVQTVGAKGYDGFLVARVI